MAPSSGDPSAVRACGIGELRAEPSIETPSKRACLQKQPPTERHRHHCLPCGQPRDAGTDEQHQLACGPFRDGGRHGVAGIRDGEHVGRELRDVVHRATSAVQPVAQVGEALEPLGGRGRSVPSRGRGHPLRAGPPEAPALPIQNAPPSSPSR